MELAIAEIVVLDGFFQFVVHMNVGRKVIGFFATFSRNFLISDSVFLMNDISIVGLIYKMGRKSDPFVYFFFSSSILSSTQCRNEGSSTISVGSSLIIE